MKSKHIAWWSGGVTSAVVCMLMINMYGLENVRIIFIDTRNEDEDTYRFKADCEKWYGCQIGQPDPEHSRKNQPAHGTSRGAVYQFRLVIVHARRWSRLYRGRFL